MQGFSILGQIQQEIGDFEQKKIVIAGDTNDNGAKYLSKNTKGYQFSQRQTLNLIDLYLNSKFESGELDSEGQRKIFLNICSFRADVAIKQVDLDVKNFVFVPDQGASEWGAYFLSRRFYEWAKTNYFGELINSVTEDFVRYGTAVVKRVGNKLERVPLRTLKNQQDAKDLKTATFVIEEHKDMTYADMQEMKGWDLSGLKMKWDETATVYERYGRVPLAYYNKQKGKPVQEGDDAKSIDCLAIVAVGVQDSQTNKQGESVLFLEQITERPYEEVHWKRQDGRWLGVGEVENLFENQITKNMLVNMRRRGLMWSSRRLFQSADTEVAKNLVRDVRDGDVIKIMPNGNISQVDMSTHGLGEFQSMEDVMEKNADQKSFTYEAATGESMPSGTPFRLGVIISNAVQAHFDLKRETLGLFFNRTVDNLILPIFKKENRDEHTLTLFANEEGVESLKQVVANVLADNEAKQQLLRGIIPDMGEIKARVMDEIKGRRSLQMLMSEGFYDTVQTKTTLVITGEQMDIPKRVETLTNVYTGMLQKGDPRAEKVLSQILALTGENYDALVGATPPSPPQMQAPMSTQMPMMPQMQPQPAV